MKTAIRAARFEDANAIAHVHVESWRTTYAGIVPDAYLAGLDEAIRAQLWRERLSEEALILVAEWNGSLVGFACAGKNREPVESCDAELYALYLLKDAQRRNIGTALLQAVANALLERNFKSMAVWVLEQNRSRGFYQRAGAHVANSKVIEIGGAKLMEVAYAWPDLKTITNQP